MTDAAGRPQDQDRPHRKRAQPSPETASLLAEYQASMRSELRAVLAELRGKLPDPGLGLINAEPERPNLTDRMRLWDLAIKLGRELGTEVDDRPIEEGAQPAAPRKWRRARVAFGPE